MKRYKYFLIIIFIIMITPIIVRTFKSKHDVNYKVKNYEIKEHFYLDYKKHYYDITVKNNNKEYIFTINKDMNKLKKIVSSIKEYKEGNITCIVPIYKKNIKSSLICINGNNQESNYNLRNNSDYKKILEKADKYIEKYDSNNDINKYNKINIYKNNIEKGENYYIWNYSGVVVANSDEVKYYKFLDSDLYDNIMAIATRRYYVLFDNSSVNDIKKVYYYDSKKKKVKEWDLDISISKKSYINGIYKDLIYVTDKKKKVQYIVNVKKEEIILIGNEEKLYTKYINNKKELLNKSDFLMKEQIFDIFDSNNYYRNNYHYYVENNYYFKETENGSKIKLFKLDNVDEWNVTDRNIILLKDGVVYSYTDELGLRKIISYNELKYNYKDIYKLGK